MREMGVGIHICVWPGCPLRCAQCVHSVRVTVLGDHSGSEVFNLAARNVHQERASIELLQAYGYAHLDQLQLNSTDQTLFATDKIRALLGWREEYDWRDILAS